MITPPVGNAGDKLPAMFTFVFQVWIVASTGFKQVFKSIQWVIHSPRSEGCEVGTKERKGSWAYEFGLDPCLHERPLLQR